MWGVGAGRLDRLDQVVGRWDFAEFEQEFVRLCHKWPEATIKLIEEALDRIAGNGDWEFGACPLCQEEIENAKKPGKDGKKPKPAKATDIWIPKARLEYLPWARYCVRHQETEERNREIA